jgi:hypothetical protein
MTVSGCKSFDDGRRESMSIDQVKLFLSMGDDLIVSLNDSLNIRMILRTDDYNPADPELFEIRFRIMVHGYPDYTVKKDDGKGLECLRLSDEQKEV